VNILLVTYYFPPINCAGSVRPAQMARWLRRCGHAVSVLTHGYTETTDPDPEIIRVHDPAFVRAHQGKRFWRWVFWRGWAELQNSCGRYASVFSPWRRAVLQRAEEIRRICRPDLILVTYPPLEVLEIGLELSRRFHVPLISDFRDGLLFRSIEEKRLHAHRCVYEKYMETEAAVAAASTLIVVVTPVLQDYFKRAYPGSRCETVFNGYDEDEWRDLPKLSLTPGYFHIVHTGRFALSDSAVDIRPFLAALLQASHDFQQIRLQLHLVGEYSRHERSRMRDLIDEEKIVLHPLVGRRETLAYQEAADLLLLITRPGVRSGIPLKLFEYIFSGKPVLALTDDAEVRRIVENSGNGWCASPLDRPAITGLLKRILADPELHGSPRRNQENSSSYSWSRQMLELNRLLVASPLS
jgi:glycosyltransferase involved in cell wall biosynthesis